MALYSLAESAQFNAGVNFPTQEIISGTNVGFTLKEWGIAIGTGFAGPGALTSVLGIGRPNLAGGGPSQDNLIADDAGNTAAAQTTSAVNWGSAPTAPVAYSHRFTLPGIFGAGILIAFPRPYTVLKGGVAANNSVVLVPLNSGAFLDTWIVVDE